MKHKHPMQPVQWDGHGVIRFKQNAIVRHLLDWASERGHDLNALAVLPFSNDDRTQFAQLIGYSVSGAGDCMYFNRRVLAEADREADKLFAARQRETRARRKS